MHPYVYRDRILGPSSNNIVPWLRTGYPFLENSGNFLFLDVFYPTPIGFLCQNNNRSAFLVRFYLGTGKIFLVCVNKNANIMKVETT